MKQNRFQVFVLGVVFAVNAVGQMAFARGSELLSLLEMPATRLILTETPEGAAIAERLIGRQVASDADVIVLFQEVSRSKNAEFARALETRLIQVQRDLRFYATAMEGEGDLRGAISELARTRLKLAKGSGDFAANRGVAEIEKLKEQVKAALEQAKSAAGEAAPAKEAASASKTPSALVAMELSGLHLNGEMTLTTSQASYSRIRNAVIEGTDLSGNVFDFSDFRGSSIRWANLKGASLRGADLTGVRLLENNLMGADLSGARLSRAQLRGSNLSGADLRGADLTDAVLGETFFRQGQYEVNLEGALFDAQTRLPFSREQAQKLGMIYLAE